MAVVPSGSGSCSKKAAQLKDGYGTSGNTPLLQFDITPSLSDGEKSSFAERVTESYTTEMATTSSHVAVTIRDRKSADLYLGRAVKDPLLSLNADIRQGRSFDRKRAFALAPMDYANNEFDIPNENMKIIFTEHRGQEMISVNRAGNEWNSD